MGLLAMWRVQYALRRARRWRTHCDHQWRIRKQRAARARWFKRKQQAEHVVACLERALRDSWISEEVAVTIDDVLHTKTERKRFGERR